MRDLLSERVLADDTYFCSNSTYETFDLSSTLDLSVTNCHVNVLDEVAVCGWANSQSSLPFYHWPRGLSAGKEVNPRQYELISSNQPSPVDEQGRTLSHVKVLVVTHPESPILFTGGNVGCSRGTFGVLQKAWHLPNQILHYWSVRQTYSGAWRVPYDESEVPTSIGMSFASWGRLTFFMTHDAKTRFSRLYFASQNSDYIEKIRIVLSECHRVAVVPGGVPLAIAQLFNDLNTVEFRLLTPPLYKTRRRFGMRPYHIPDEGLWPEQQGDGLVESMRDLTNIAQGYAFERSHFVTTRRLVRTARCMLDWYRRTLPGPIPQEQFLACDEIAAQLDALNVMLDGQERIIGLRQEEVQGLIQTVYAMLSNQDNQSNYKIAKASLRIAEDSRKVAILTRQDSTDMRVIAGATLVFLPATFVATLFSTSMFNLQPANNSLVSSWIWLYFVVTITLTAVVMLIWRLLSRARDKETARLLHLKDAELVRAIADEEQGGSVTTAHSVSGTVLDELRRRSRRTEAVATSGGQS